MTRRKGVWFLTLLGALAVAALLLGWFAPGQLQASSESFLSRPFFMIGDISVSPAFLIKLFLLVVLLTLLSRAARIFVRRTVLESATLDEGQRFAIERGISYLVYLLGFAVGAQTLGVHLESLVFLGGAVGIGVGLGLQNIANNFLSGLILLTERPIKVGDRIELADLNGDVVHIAARSTWVRTNDNIVIIVPNSEFVTNRVINWTANDRRVRFPVPVGVSYSSRPEEVRRILLDVAARNPDVLRDPAPDVTFRGFGDSSLDFELRVWTTTQVRTPTVLRSDLYFAIFAAFREHGVEIPFPQRDLHVRSVSAPIPFVTEAPRPI